MTEHHARDQQARDDRLRAHLRTADPAARLTPADPAEVAGLTRTAMAGPTSPAAPAAPAVRRRTPLLLAAAAAVVVAGVGVWALDGPDEDGPQVALDPAPAATSPTSPTPPAAPSPSPTATAPGPGADTMTVLRVPGATTARCAVPTAEALRGQDLAFEGTVLGLEDTVAVIEVSEVYAGSVSDLVRVQPPPAEIADLLAGVRFEVGTTYLVSATGGQVSLCGLSAEAEPALAALYAEAFGG